METQRNTQRYDLFKLIVALILLALLIILMLSLRGPQAAAGEQKPTAANTAAVAESSPSDTAVPPAAAVPAAAVPTATEPAATPTTAAAAAAPTATAPAPTPTAAAPTPTTAAVEAPTPTPAQAEAAAPTPTPDAAQAADGGCPLAMPPRLSVGTNARVMSNLNLRASSGINSGLIRTNPAGTLLEITGGPVCEPLNGAAYLWWQVRAPDGTQGWSAEGSSTGGFYFLQPVP